MRGQTVFTAAVVLILASAVTAQANTVVVQNTTDNVAYSSDTGSAVNYFNGGTSPVGSSSIGGGEFATSGLSVTTSLITGGNYSVDFQYSTMFSGHETVGYGSNVASVYYPDIFIRSPASGYSSTPFNFALSLGQQTSNGGLAAGFYSVNSYLTSTQVWGGRSGFDYGGAYTNTTQAGYTSYAAPVVLTSGTKLGDVAFSSTQAGAGYLVDVQVVLSAAEEAALAAGVDVFWGTGDCANDSFLASVTGVDVAVPEPASFLLLAAGLGCLAFVRKSRVYSI